MKCVVHDGQLFFETLESIPAQSDLIVAQSDHTFNGYILMRAIAGLIIGKLKRKLIRRRQLHKMPITMPITTAKLLVDALCSKNFPNVKLRSKIQEVICHSILCEIDFGKV